MPLVVGHQRLQALRGHLVARRVDHHPLGGGLLITVMQVGLALGSALVGALYLGWDGDFVRTGYVLAVAMLAVGGLTLTLPRRGASS